MSLNIKKERTHALVRELATLRGVSQTEAVTEAVELRLASLRQPHHHATLAADLLRLGREFREFAGDIDLNVDDLYDEETGLPR